MKKFIQSGNMFRWIVGIVAVLLWLKLYEAAKNLGAIAHAEGRVAVTTLPDGSKVVTSVKENK